MATTISLASNAQIYNSRPDCDQAHSCCWFEKTGAGSSRCANRSSMVCHKRRDAIFSPFIKKK